MKATKKSLVIQVISAVLILTAIVGIAYAGFMRTFNYEFDLTVRVSRIDLSLAEATTDMIVPGTTVNLPAQPAITVGAHSQPCWIFAEITKTQDFNSYLSYDATVADGWTPLTGVANVYYRQVERQTQAQTFTVLTDTTLEIAPTLTDKQLAVAAEQSISVTAYAVQQTDEINNATLAWMEIRP